MVAVICQLASAIQEDSRSFKIGGSERISLKYRRLKRWDTKSRQRFGRQEFTDVNSNQDFALGDHLKYAVHAYLLCSLPPASHAQSNYPLLLTFHSH